MLSFNQLQEKKTKIKINPKKEDVMEGSCGSYSKGGEVKKNHGEDCDCTKCDKKRRKEDLGDEKTVSTEALAYDSQEEVSEESNQEIAETETKTLLTFEELQYAKTLNEEQLQEFLKGLFGGGNKVPSTANSPTKHNPGGQMPSHVGLAGKLGQRRQMMNQLLGQPDQKVLGFSKGGKVTKKVKKEEVELVNEMPLPGAGKQGANMGSSSGGGARVGGSPANASTAALALGRSKGGIVKKKKTYKESMEFFEDRAADAKKSLEKVKKRQGVLDDYEKKTGKKLDINKSVEARDHKKNFPGAKRQAKKVKGAKETPAQTQDRRIRQASTRIATKGYTSKEKKEVDSMAKHASRYD